MSDEREPDDGSWDDEPWTEEDERRYQERRAHELLSRHRRRRQAAVFAVVVVLVLGTGTTAAGVYQGWWHWPPWAGEPAPVRTVVACPTPEVTAAAVAEVTLTVLNSTNRAGLAGATAEELTARGFAVGAIGNDPAPEPLPGTAVVRHGPEGLLAARTVAAQVDGATLADDGRAGTAVELSLGQAFAGLRPAEAAAAAMAPAPVASPAGCVAPTPAGTETAPVQPAATSQAAPTG